MRIIQVIQDKINEVMQVMNNNITDPKFDVIVKHSGRLTGRFTKFGNEVFEWCNKSGIDADLLHSWFDEEYYSSWRIMDDQQRLLFSLKWVT